MDEKPAVARTVLPIPGRAHVGLTTYDAKDPDTSFPPITAVRPPAGAPNVLINIVSRRVRQLNAGGGGLSRPLVDVPASMGLADIALTEIIEDKMGWELPEEVAAVRLIPKKRKKH